MGQIDYRMITQTPQWQGFDPIAQQQQQANVQQTQTQNQVNLADLNNKQMLRQALSGGQFVKADGSPDYEALAQKVQGFDPQLAARYRQQGVENARINREYAAVDMGTRKEALAWQKTNDPLVRTEAANFMALSPEDQKTQYPEFYKRMTELESGGDIYAPKNAPAGFNQELRNGLPTPDQYGGTNPDGKPDDATVKANGFIAQHAPQKNPMSAAQKKAADDFSKWSANNPDATESQINQELNILDPDSSLMLDADPKLGGDPRVNRIITAARNAATAGAKSENFSVKQDDSDRKLGQSLRKENWDAYCKEVANREGGFEQAGESLRKMDMVLSKPKITITEAKLLIDAIGRLANPGGKLTNTQAKMFSQFGGSFDALSNKLNAIASGNDQLTDNQRQAIYEYRDEAARAYHDEHVDIKKNSADNLSDDVDIHELDSKYKKPRYKSFYFDDSDNIKPKSEYWKTASPTAGASNGAGTGATPQKPRVWNPATGKVE